MAGSDCRVDLRLNRVLMSLVALWPPRGGGWRTSLYLCYSGAVLLLEVGFVVAQLSAVVNDWGDLDEVTVNLCLAVAYVMAVFKIYSFFRMRRLVGGLVDGLDRNMQVRHVTSCRICLHGERDLRARVFQRYAGDGDDAVEEEWRLSERRGVVVTVTYMLVGLVAFVSCVSLPLLRPSTACNSTESSSLHRCRLQKDLPAKVLVPRLLLDDADGAVFGVCYGFVVVAIFYGYACTCLLDVFYTRLIIYASGQLRVANLLLKNAKDNGRLKDVVRFHLDIARFSFLPSVLPSLSFISFLP